jgi:predicted enzyme related to lactoylglutathione lyase
MKPISFDLTVKDLPASRKFLEEALGWKFTAFPMPFDYFRIDAGPADEVGIDGGIGALAEVGEAAGGPMVALTLETSDIDAMAKKIVASGGRLVGTKIDIPGIGWHLSFAESGGLVFGLLQPDESVH